MDRDVQLLELKEQLCSQGVGVCFGAELEFYLRSQDGDIPAAGILECFATKLHLATNLPLQTEKGLGQYELALVQSRGCPAAYAAHIEHIRQTVTQVAGNFSIIADFSPKPYADDYGSALHLHFHLYQHDDTPLLGSSDNLFSSERYEDNPYIKRSVYGVLGLLHNDIGLLCSKQDLARLAPTAPHAVLLNIPAGLCWGGNNRTTALRIPDGPTFARRLELRVPSADCSPWRAIEFVQRAIQFGLRTPMLEIERHLPAYPRIYGNAFDPYYQIIRWHELLE